MDSDNSSHPGDQHYLTEQKPNQQHPAPPPIENEDDDESEASSIRSHIAPQDQPNTSTSISTVKSSSTQQTPHSRVAFANNDRDEDSGEEEGPARLDPAWGIKRTDSAHILDTIHRSPSFPAPASDSCPSSPRHQVPSQEFGRTFSQTKVDMDDGPEPLQGVYETTSPAILEEAEQPTMIEDQERARFAEGMPLISANLNPHRGPLSESSQDLIPHFDTIEGETPGDFFSQLQSGSYLAAETRPSNRRKETSEVLNGLEVGDMAPDSPPFSAAIQQQTTEEKDLAAVLGGDLDDQDPWKTVMDDDTDFLVEDADDLLPDSDEEPSILPPKPAQQTQAQLNAGFSRTNSNLYAPHQPSTAELTGFSPTTRHPGLGRQAPNPMQALQTLQQRPAVNDRAESFVDQAKGGYKSPYDLPMDLAPKKRVQSHRIVPPTNPVPPPPRSSSIIADKQLQSPFSPHPPTFNQLASDPSGLPPTAPPVPAEPVPNAQQTSSGFFEELPVIPRTRQLPQRAPSAQLPTATPRQPIVTQNSFVASPPRVQQQMAPQNQQVPAQIAGPYAQYQLQQPTKIDPYANVLLQSSHPGLTPAPPAANARYSPAPPSLPNGIRPSLSPRYSPVPPSQAAGPRYSPAPPAQSGPASNRYASQPLPGASLPHLPRTSSPLAQHRRSVDDSADQSQQTRPLPHHSLSSSVPYTASFSPSNTISPPLAVDPTKQENVPPKRSQTQSPSRQIARSGVPPRIALPPNRPASAFGQLSPTRSRAPTSVLSPPRVSQPRQAEQLDFILPTDSTVQDPLERWKGAPMFAFGFGGTVVSSFPGRTPRYSAAATRPQIKATPGEVRTRTLDSILDTPTRMSKFPGPLKGKAKKKDVLAWLSTSTSEFNNEIMSNPSRQLEEKLLLWKVVQVLVEYDGSLQSPQAVQSISAILMPDVYSSEEVSASHHALNDASMGIYRPASFTARVETVDPVAVEHLRKNLLKGKREDAVWQAVDSRLWSHAMLLASTLDKKVWKQVVSEFVKQEVKTIGADSDSLCALYEILGGNMEESIDQLVPPSARAGLQMVSKVDTIGPTRNALDGLDRWKETLCLILNNRSFEDQRALITLARLLSDYGRIEASHLCYLIARNVGLPTMFGGADDPNSMVVLLGADHKKHASTIHNDNDAIMLTEIYEFASTTLAAGAVGAPMPYLAVYKLQRAKDLTDAGLRTEAQAYCDAVAAGLKSSTKHSLYYNPLILGEVEDLSNRLKQIPVASASWIAKPSIEKVSGSLFNKFSSFVTGEDSDAESKGSARDAAEAGPFANVSGSPSLSRTTSQTDLYGSHPAQMQMTPAIAPTSAGSRYAPNGMSSARSSSEYTRGRTSVEHQRSPPSTSHSNEQRNMFAPVQQLQQGQYSPLASPPVSGYQPNTIYQPIADAYMPSVAEEIAQPLQALYTPEGHTTAANGVSSMQPAFGGYTPVEQLSHDEPEVPTQDVVQGTFEASADSAGYGYQPPDDSGYAPYQPEPESDDENSKTKKSFVADNDDYARVSHDPSVQKSVPAAENDDAAKKDRKKANDEAANAAFIAAAEADAQRVKQQGSQKKASGSWLGGWFGGKKEESLDAGSTKSSGAEQKVHRVHLGESKMKLYYDKDKKKWINPDNPDASDKKATLPPPRASTGSVGPPMSGPPRSVSTPYSLPPGGLSRSGTPASVAIDTGSEGGESRPGTSNSLGPGFAATLPPGTQQSLGLGSGSALPTPPGSSGGLAPPTSGTPSRPTSALSSAGGLDDLLGGPPSAGGRRVSGRTAKGKKGRYVDVMAK